MLVLTRKNDESIYIGSHIKIKVIQADDGRVKLGIDAPENVKVHREEIFELIKSENKKAGSIDKADLPDFSIFNKQ